MDEGKRTGCMTLRVRECIEMHLSLSTTLTNWEICQDQDTTGESLCILRDLFQHVMGWVTHLTVNEIVVNTMNSGHGDDSHTFLNKGKKMVSPGDQGNSDRASSPVFFQMLITSSVASIV